MNMRLTDVHDKVTIPLLVPILCVGEMLTEPLHYLHRENIVQRERQGARNHVHMQLLISAWSGCNS